MPGLTSQSCPLMTSSDSCIKTKKRQISIQDETSTKITLRPNDAGGVRLALELARIVLGDCTIQKQRYVNNNT